MLLYHVFCDAIPFDDRAAALLQLFLPFSGIMAIFIFFVVSGFSLSVDYLDRGDLKVVGKNCSRPLLPPGDPDLPGLLSGPSRNDCGSNITR